MSAPVPTSVYADSLVIASAVRQAAEDGLFSSYWLKEAACHIEGLYRCAVEWERAAKAAQEQA